MGTGEDLFNQGISIILLLLFFIFASKFPSLIGAHAMPWYKNLSN